MHVRIPTLRSKCLPFLPTPTCLYNYIHGIIRRQNLKLLGKAVVSPITDIERKYTTKTKHEEVNGYKRSQKATFC